MAFVRQVIRFAMVALMIAGGFGFSPNPADSSASTRLAHKDETLILARRERAAAFAALDRRLQEAGRVRVIVRLNTAFAPEADLGAAQALDQRSAIGQAAEALRAELGAAAEGFESLDRLPIAILSVDAQGLTTLQNSPRVAGIQEDALETTQLADSGALVGAAGTLGVHAAGYTGAGYAVAILDVGVDKLHPFLSGRVVVEACFSTTYNDGTLITSTLCPNGQTEQVGNDAGRPCSVNNADPLHSCDHGTHVAGIAAGHSYSTMVSDGATAIYNGIAPDAGIIAVQVFSKVTSAATCGGASFTPCYLTFPSDQLRALNWLSSVVATYNVASVNMSLGGTTKYTTNCNGDTRKVAIDNLRSAGVATFIASGNSGYTDGLSAPGCISTAISVGSTKDGGPGATPADAVSNFSNSASILTLFGPGEWIQSSTTGNGYTLKSGTSMATPHAAGGWLVLKQMYPADTVDQLLNRMLTTGVTVTDTRNGVSKPRLALNNALPSGFVEAPSIGFGQVVIDLAADATVTFNNPSSLSVTLTSPTLTGAGLSYKGGSYPGTGGTCSATVAARSSCTIVVRYAPTTPGTLAGQLSVTYGPGQTATLALSGVGRALCTGNLAINAVFENATGWTQSTTAGALPLRTTAVADGTGPAAPADGSGWARFGGYTGGGPAVTQAITQSVTIPSGSASLEFVVDISRADAGATGLHTFRAALDGTPVFSITALDRSRYATKQVVRLNIGAYATGGAHALTFTAITPADGTVVNFNLDDVGVCSPSFYPQWLPIVSR